jgi:ribose transport system substrate-binding protein
MMGQESARVIGDALEGKGTVAVLYVPSAGSTSVVRTDNFKEVMAEKYPDITLVSITAENFTREAGLRTGSDMLVAHPHIDAVFSIDDESSMGILQAIREAGRKDVKLISGGGGNQAYFREIHTDKDIYLFSATYSPRMAGDALETAVRILNGETVEKQIIIPPTIITRDNVEHWFADDSPY